MSKTKKKTFIVGDTVWFAGSWITKAKIMEIDETNNVANLKTPIGTCWQPMDILYHSEQECRDAEKAEETRIRNEYRKKINSIDDLVIFLFNHDTNDSEFMDYNARAVAIEKASELLGMSETRLLGMEPEIG